MGNHAAGKQKQFAALPYRVSDEGSVEILIGKSLGSEQWVLFKGNPEKGMKPHEVAALEARQEAGVIGDVSPIPLGGFLYDKHLAPGRVVRCHLQVYLLHFTQQLDDWEEKDQREIEWVTVDVAIDRLSKNTNIPKKQKLGALLKGAKKRIFDAAEKTRKEQSKKKTSSNPPTPT